jgi:hypothetical protein
MTFGGCVEICVWIQLSFHRIADNQTHLTLVDSFIPLRDIVNQQPEIVGKLQVHRIPQISDECVCADG